MIDADGGFIRTRALVARIPFSKAQSGLPARQNGHKPDRLDVAWAASCGIKPTGEA